MRALSSQGAAIVVNDYFADRAENMAEELCASGAVAKAVAFDASDRDAVLAGAKEAIAELGVIDILVANVGTLPNGQNVTKFLQMDPEEWPQHVNNNLYSTLNCIHAVAPAMKEQGWGALWVSPRMLVGSVMSVLPFTVQPRRA